MKEEFLQYIWANALFPSNEVIACSGNKIRILDVGSLNKDAGADFFNARIQIGDTEFAGNVEIHLRNSDWYRHGHHVNPAYDNVVLSVVKEADVRIYNCAGREVETIVLEYAEPIYQEYLFMQNSECQPGCRRNLRKVDGDWLGMNLQALAIERLIRKCDDIGDILGHIRNDWQECFYRLLCKYWAGNVNAEPFYRLALELPYKVLLKHADQPRQLEALLLGCSGLLEEAPPDEYVDMLQQEFHYLQAKHELNTLSASQWKFMRTRPDAFPTVRIALLAAFLRQFSDSVGRIMEAKQLREVMDVLDIQASAYWDIHYLLGQISQNRPKRLGWNLKKTIVINAVVPFLFSYGKHQGDETYCERALAWLEELDAEDNYIITDWKNCGICAVSALQTQALIQLRKEYCDKHRCLQCRVGREVLKKLTP